MVWLPFTLPFCCYLIYLKISSLSLALVLAILYNLYHTKKSAKELFKKFQNCRNESFFPHKGVSIILHAPTSSGFLMHILISLEGLSIAMCSHAFLKTSTLILPKSSITLQECWWKLLFHKRNCVTYCANATD